VLLGAVLAAAGTAVAAGHEARPTATPIAVAAAAQPDARAVPVRPDVALTAPLRPLTLSPVGTHAAFPGLVMYPGRTLTLQWRQGSDHADHRDGTIDSATSLDAGLSYHDPETTLAGGTDYRDASPAAIGDELWTTYFTGSASNGAQGAYLIRGDRPAVRIDPQLPYAAISAPIVQLPGGTLGAVFYGHAAGEARDSAWFARSVDGGATWQSRRIADGPADGRDYQEPWLVVRDGVLHVLHRYGSWDSIGITSSTDSGATWSTPRKILSQATGRPTTLVLASGTMLTIYRHTGTRAAMMATSRDGGTTWRSGGILLSPPGPLGMTYAAAVEVLPGVAHVVVAGENTDGSSTLYRGWLAESGTLR
jgi:hypothetical protein